ncbi:MAG: cation:proton antiporter [Nitrospirota bacterium]|nr:cation:proton antiporter [Nitrospirota bacterium]
MPLDPAMPALVGALLAILGFGLVLRALRLPQVLAYLCAGVALGPHGLAVVTDHAVLTRLGGMGVVLLLFFVGMELHPRELVGAWRVAVGGTLLQVALCIALVAILARWTGWPPERVVLLGCIVSMSSTVVVLKLLTRNSELDTPTGHGVAGVLVAQDVLLIPMLLGVSMMGGQVLSGPELATQISGVVALLGVVGWMALSPRISLPWLWPLRADHEMEVFAALALCFGLAWVTGLAGLSAALGALVAGMLVGAAREAHWVRRHVAPFQVVFVALFFVSVGMLVDLAFLRDFLGTVLLFVLLVLVAKTVVNAAILRLLHGGWRDSLYGGALLAQIGEFSFVLAALGLQVGVIGMGGYQMAISVIALSLAVSPLWIGAARRLTGRTASGVGA